MTNRIYAYTIPGKDDEPWTRRTGNTTTQGTGVIKVGQTTRPRARDRIKEQLGTAYPKLDGVTILYDQPATRDDGTEFTDHDVHATLVKQGIRRPGGEWFEATLDEIRAAINTVRTGTPFNPARTETFPMRPEQADAVNRTAAYFTTHADDKRPLRYLWNAKMRFGKTFTAYQLARRMGWKRVLVLTYKPAVRTQWRDDLATHVDFAGWEYVDRNSTTEERDNAVTTPAPVIWFASFQDLSGRDTTGGVKTHNENIHTINWDAIILDEYHFGAWRDTARDMYDPTDTDLAETEEPDEQVDEDDLGLTADHILYLSGTPFRALSDGEFTEDAIYDWTYVNEQSAKKSWNPDRGPNPYVDLPGMRMYTYEMGADAGVYANDGEFNGFSLTEFFKASKADPPPAGGADGRGGYVFARPDDVSEFLEMLRGKLSDQMKSLIVGGQKAPFPYEHAGFKDNIRHSVWYVPDVASAYAMRDMLEKHPYFSSFEVVVAAGPKAGQGAAALPPVEAAIALADDEGKSGSITLTCGKLMTGVTVREWGAILMLRSLTAPETYFQAAFRVQSPWSYRDAEGTVTVRKPECYVFEFDPNRALSLVAMYGTGMSANGGTTPSEAISELMNFLPIYAFSGGQMTKLDSSAVLDWASVGIGASALAARWNSPLLVDVNEATLSNVLNDPALMEKLAHVEDFRALVNNANKVVTSTKLLKKAKREQGGELTPTQRKVKDDTARMRKEIREKLQKFLARIPVFMYATDFREEALKHVIESLDSDLFERVTGLTVEDFNTLNRAGLFNARHLEHAIYQFRAFERSSLRYAGDPPGGPRTHHRVGLWDRTVDEDELGMVTPAA